MKREKSDGNMWSTFVFSLLFFATKAEQDNQKENYHQYCVIGAGPAGLQMGYFLKSAERDYMIYEKGKAVRYEKYSSKKLFLYSM